MIKNIIAAAVTSLIVAVLALSVTPAPSQAPSDIKPLGSQIETTQINFGAGFITGAEAFVGKGLTKRGVNATSTSATSQALIPRDIIGYSTLVITPTVGKVNMTLPASTTFPTTFLPKSGDRTDFIFFNATTSTALNGTIGFVPGAGSLIEVASSTAIAMTASTSPQKGTKVEILRKWDSDLIFFVAPFF